MRLTHFNSMTSSVHPELTVKQIESILPQTQCKNCGYDGCLPYAEAILKGESINRCSPGGEKVIHSLASLLHQSPIPLHKACQPTTPPHTVIIREDECIGCTKCIQACPMDAIIGAAKQMHTVITKDCTGCDLCIAPCPTNCIDISPLTHQQAKTLLTPSRRERNRHLFKQRKIRQDATSLNKAILRSNKVRHDNDKDIPSTSMKRSNTQFILNALTAQKKKLQRQINSITTLDERSTLAKQLQLIEKKINSTKQQAQDPQLSKPKVTYKSKAIQQAKVRAKLKKISLQLASLEQSTHLFQTLTLEKQHIEASLQSMST